MRILISGNEDITEELKKMLPEHLNATYSSNIPHDLSVFEAIIDAGFDSNQKNMAQYATLKNKPVIVSAVKKQLASAAHEFGKPINCHLIGMNLLPGFINRKLVELSLLKTESSQAVEQLAVKLDWNIRIVEDRVGMVTPRVVCMIINEACYTLQEGTADIKDIDTAMKLGTNYPYGPFEWADKIGINNVYETLLALYDDTKDERYKICPLLKTKYLKGESFIN
jgi:3-hydroxybutyryl-CoA dehydrogenase